MSSHRQPRRARAVSPRILCVEPRTNERLALCSALAGPGLTIECVGSGDEAVRLLEAHPGECRLLIVGDSLPKTNAVALARRVRGHGYRGCIVVLCSEVPRRRAAAYRALESICVLVKPVPPGFLRAAAEASLHRAA